MTLKGDDLSIKESGWYSNNMRTGDMKDDN